MDSDNIMYQKRKLRQFNLVSDITQEVINY